MASLSIVINVLCALVEYRMIKSQGELMDRAIAAVNQSPLAENVPLEQA